jgi:hypothetical protein
MESIKNGCKQSDCLVSKHGKAASKFIKLSKKISEMVSLQRTKKVVFDLRLRGPLQNVKTKSGSHSDLGLFLNVKKWN